MRLPLYRQSFDAPALLRQHPPVYRHPHKAALFAIAYPDGVAGQGEIVVTRWSESSPKEITLPQDLATEILPNFYDYKPVRGGAASVQWHVNFADPRLFVAYGSPLFAQDEMQVAEHPLLGCVREALLANGLSAKTSDETGATPILIHNIERRIEIATHADASAGLPTGIYGNLFAAAPLDVIRRATRRVDPPTFSNIIAMAAPSGGQGDYTEQAIEHIFVTAFTAFKAAMHESVGSHGEPRETVVHTGFWGCGAFGGNRKLMIALQSLAGRAAGVNQMIFHVGDTPGVEDASRGLDVAESLAFRCGSPCSLDKLVGRSVILGYQWGVSDGN